MIGVTLSPSSCILCFSFIINVFCERILDNKIETKVEIDVTYMFRVKEDAVLQKSLHFIYSIPSSPKTISSDLRVSNRQGSSNSNNVRHGFRFSNIEKGTGAFTMSTYENEGMDSGARLRNNVVMGKLIHIVNLSDRISDHNGNFSSLPTSWSHNGCQDMLNSVQGNWVALVQTGSCSVENKLKQIMKLSNQPVSILIYGSSQVIIKQDPYVPNQDEPPMVIFVPWSNIQGVVQACYNSSGNITLPVEFRTKRNGSMYSYGGSVNDQSQCNITIKVYTSSDDNFLNKTSVLFVSISFILLMVISLAWLMFYYVQRFRYIHTKEQFSRRLAHMAKKAVAKIPVKTIKQGDKETDAEIDNCAICIECYKPSDTVRILPCKHYFHKSCIDPWLLEQRSCPMCKLNILHAYGFLPNERGSMISEDHLSELDSSLELQFMPGSTVTSYPGPCTRIQTHCQARNSSDSGTISISIPPPVTNIMTSCSNTNSTLVVNLPSIFTSDCNYQRRWMSLRLKRPLRTPVHHIDRSVSLRHLSSSSVEERTTFLPQNGRRFSQSATSATTMMASMVIPGGSSLSHWQNTTTSTPPPPTTTTTDSVVAIIPGDCSRLDDEGSQ